MEITFAPGASHTVLAPQLKWSEKFDDYDYKYCKIAGLEMSAIKESDEKTTYELWYAGYRLAGLETMESAQAIAPEFAKRVLLKMINSIEELRG